MPGSSSSLDGSVADSESLDHLTSQMGGVSLNNEPAPAPPRVKSHPYFRTHRGFNYDPKQSDFVNFGRLASKYKWSAGGRPWKTEWLKCFPESWNVTRKAQGFTGASIIEFFAFFAFDHYESDYNSFVDEHAKVKGWSVGSDGWRRKWLKIVGYPYVKSSITDGANAEIEAVRNEAALQIRYNAESACLPTALPIRNPNQYFEAHRSAAFVPDYNKAFSSDFANLAQVKKWKVKSSQYKQEKQKAFDEEFNRWFDLCPSQDQILQILQALCLEIDVEVGESIRKCKKVNSTTYETLIMSGMANFDKGSQGRQHQPDQLC